MRRVPESSDAAAPLGSGTRAPLRTVPGRACGRALRDRAPGAGGRDAFDPSGRQRLRGCGRDARAAAAVPGHALARARLSVPGCVATRPSDLRLDRDPPALSGEIGRAYV